MTMDWQEQLRPGVGLSTIVRQATAALIAMDAERLEELALCCRDLNLGLEANLEGTEALGGVAADLRNCTDDLRLLHRVLYETRANLTVLSRLHAIRVDETAVALSEPAQLSVAAGREVWGVWDWWERKVDYGDN